MRRIWSLVTTVTLAAALAGLWAQPALANYDSHSSETTLRSFSTGAVNFELPLIGEGSCEIGSLLGTTKGVEIESEVWTSSTLTLHPEFIGCEFIGFNAEVKTTGCNFVLEAATTTGGAPWDAHAGLEIECETGKKIEIIAGGEKNCKVTIGGGQTVGLVDFQNKVPATGSEAWKTEHRGFDIHPSYVKTNAIRYTGTAGFCITGGEKNGGRLEGTYTVQGFVGAGPQQVGVWVT